jgi:hypothetical protein
MTFNETDTIIITFLVLVSIISIWNIFQNMTNDSVCVDNYSVDNYSNVGTLPTTNDDIVKAYNRVVELNPYLPYEYVINKSDPLSKSLDYTSYDKSYRNNRYYQRMIDQNEKDNEDLTKRINKLEGLMLKVYNQDGRGNYIVHGWFAQFFNVIESPQGVILGEELTKTYGAPMICFRAKEGYPFLGTPAKPIFLPKSDYIGFRAMTVFKIPKTGFYDFKVLTDDGMRLYYQKTKSSVMANEKNVRNVWNLLIDAWKDQAETWLFSKKLYFNENDLVLLRCDYYELTGYSSACVRVRYYVDGETSDRYEESNLPYDRLFCSLMWSSVPLIGFV